MKLLLFHLIGQCLTLTSASGQHPGSDKLASSDTAGKCQQACATLASDFAGRAHYKGSDANFTVWDQKQAEVTYECRVQPRDAREVSRILQVLVHTWCKFAVKGGGHYRFPNDSVSVGGVTVDLGG
ncbi:hypothetical protein ARSEF4850_009244 [Beauveria asiatica]